MFEVPGQQGLGGSCVVKMPHTSHVLTPEKEGFIDISGRVSGVLTPQSKVIFRPFIKYKNIVLL